MKFDRINITQFMNIFLLAKQISQNHVQTRTKSFDKIGLNTIYFLYILIRISLMKKVHVQLYCVY